MNLFESLTAFEFKFQVIVCFITCGTTDNNLTSMLVLKALLTFALMFTT